MRTLPRFVTLPSYPATSCHKSQLLSSLHFAIEEPQRFRQAAEPVS
jgi:hypothetical protein